MHEQVELGVTIQCHSNSVVVLMASLLNRLVGQERVAESTTSRLVVEWRSSLFRVEAVFERACTRARVY